MMSDDDEPKATPPQPPNPLLGPALDRLGVAELEAHIAGLRAEIARAEAEIGRKRGLRAAADSVFRP